MFRKLLIIFALFTINSVYAGSYENALQKNDKVFLYFYTTRCHTCKAFDPIFDNIQTQNKDYGFVKVDAETSYGTRLIMKFKGRFVPYIILTDSKTKKSVNVNHACIMNEMCLLRAMKNFHG